MGVRDHLREIYFDNSATTAVCRSACDKAYEVMYENYGNAASLHSKGLRAENEIITAKKTIAEMLSTDKNQIYFTSGGTEANNLAVFGACNSRKKLGNRIVTTQIEHSSVLEPIKQLENQGFEVIYIKPDSNGHISEKDIFDAVNGNTIFVSIMLVNNEVGTVLPVLSASKAIKQKKAPALLHCDAVQAFGKMNVKPAKLGADLLTVSSHKIHGPKGVGALYIKKGVHLTPLIYGGEQQSKIRPGTENVPAIAAFCEACKEINLTNSNEKVFALNERLRNHLNEIDGVVINSPDDASPYIVNFSVPGIRSETMLHFLAMNGIFVSSGSACAKGKPSYVLTAMGLEKEIADSALRVSFCKNNTIEEVDIFAEALKKGIATLARAK